MRKVKYISIDGWSYSGLTIGKVYDVVKWVYASDSKYDVITLLNDLGEEKCYSLSYGGCVEFFEFTSEYRSETIEEILV